MPPEAAAGPTGAPGGPSGALLQVDGRRLELGVPAAAPLLRPGAAATALYLPLLHVRF